MKYCCENCGKTFVKEEDALGCEKAHEIEQERRRISQVEKDKRYKEIENEIDKLNDLVNKYNTDYNEAIHIVSKYPSSALWL